MKRANPLPIQIVMIATALALALIVSLGVFVWSSIGAVKNLQVKTIRLQERTAELAGLNDAVSSTARLAVVERGERLKSKYQVLSDRRIAALLEIGALRPDPEIEAARSQAEAICRRMSNLERQALDLVEQGKIEEGRGILAGDPYVKDRRAFSDLVTDMATLLDLSARRDLEFQERRGRFVILSVAVAISLLLFTWIASLRISGNLVARRQREEAERAESDRMAAFVAEVRETLAKGGSLDGIASAIVRHLGLDGSQIWVAKGNGFALQSFAGVPIGVATPRQASAVVEQLVSARKPTTGTPSESVARLLLPAKCSAFAALPLIIGDKEIGLISFFKKSPIGDLEVRAVTSVVDLVAHGIERTNAEALTLQYAADLEQANRRLEDQTRTLARTAEELAVARDAALESANLKSQFLASVSHEIRTPMTGIIGMTDLTLDTTLNEEQLEYVRLIKSSAHSLLSLLNGILDFSKIESGKIELEQIDFDFRDMLADSLKPFAQKATEKGIVLRSHVAPEVPRSITGDPNRLRQILVNLVANALKFTEEGEVAVESVVERTEPGTVHLQISVTDTGIGIPRDKRSVIFQPFTQADGSTTRKYGGTGLGLAICQQLLRRMGGRIWVEGEPGVGSTFTFVVPFSVEPRSDEATGPAPEVVEPAPAPVQNGHYRILMAEDNAVSQTLMKRLLEKSGHSVVAVSTGIEALEALDKEPFDAVLMNLQMPSLGGLEATAAIRLREKEGQLPSGPHIPIIATTASAMKGDREKCLDAGMDGYVSKPIRREDLFQAIETLVRKNRESKAAIV